MNKQEYQTVIASLKECMGTNHAYLFPEPKEGENLRWFRYILYGDVSVEKILNAIDQTGFSEKVDDDLVLGMPERTPRLEFKFIHKDNLVFEDLNAQ